MGGAKWQVTWNQVREVWEHNGWTAAPGLEFTHTSIIGLVSFTVNLNEGLEEESRSTVDPDLHPKKILF